MANIYTADVGYLYIVRCNNYYKIGISLLPEQRINLIKTDNYQPVETIAIYKSKDIKGLEEGLHEVLAEEGFHERGEWFKLNHKHIGVLLELIEDVVKESY